jgi:hypothetical protein
MASQGLKTADQRRVIWNDAGFGIASVARPLCSDNWSRLPPVDPARTDLSRYAS